MFSGLLAYTCDEGLAFLIALASKVPPFVVLRPRESCSLVCVRLTYQYSCMVGLVPVATERERQCLS